MALFRQVKINIPLLDAIAQVPRYAKFLKELCTSKKKLKGVETVEVGENVSSIIQKRLPQKCKDPRVFTVPCKLGDLFVPRAMLDLGASINVLPYSIFKTLNLGELKRTGVNIQLADRSLVHPKGVLEDVLVQVNELVFPADFYVLDMGDDDAPNASNILLGRPFLKTSRTKIDVFNGTLSMEFDGDIVNFNIFDKVRYPSDVSSVNYLGIIEPPIHNYTDVTNHQLLALDMNRNSGKGETKETTVKEELKEGVVEKVIEEKVKKRRKKRKWKWIRVNFPYVLKT